MSDEIEAMDHGAPLSSFAERLAGEEGPDRGYGSASGPAEVAEHSEGWARVTLSWCRFLLLVGALFFGVRTFVVEAFKIPTSSMEKTLLVGDFLLVNKAIYGARIPGTDVHLPAFAEPKRGDVVVFHPPHEPEKNYVKRLVGVPGDTLRMVEKRLIRNGRPVVEEYARHLDRSRDAVHSGMTWQPQRARSLPRQLGTSRRSPGPLLRSRRQSGQQRGLPLLGLRAAVGDPRAALDRLLLVRPRGRRRVAVDRGRALGPARNRHRVGARCASVTKV